MRKKNYIKFANILNKALKEGTNKIDTFDIILNEMKIYFQQDYNKFNETKFINAVLK